MTSRSKSTWRAVMCALVMATGSAVVWGILLGWIISSADTLLGGGADLREDIYVAADGTPVVNVQSRTTTDYVTLSRRTIDGEEWPVDYEHWLSPAYLAPRRERPGLVRFPRPWRGGGRVGGGTDGRRPPTAWYVIQFEEPSPRCYFAGFDAYSKLPVGYIATNGFRAGRPAEEAQFALPDTNERELARFVASSQYLSYWSMVWHHNLIPDSEPDPWLVYVTEPDRLWEIDLRQRSAQVVIEMADLISVGHLRIAEPTLPNATTEKDAARPLRSSIRLTSLGERRITGTFNLYQVTSQDDEPKYSGAIAVRSDDRIVLYHSSSGKRREFSVPANLAREPLYVYWIGTDQLLVRLHKGSWSGGPITQLMWIGPDGTVQRSEELKLAGYVPDSPREAAWRSSGLVPISIVWLVGMAIGAPLYLLQANRATNYTDALATAAGIAWPPLVVVLAVSVVVAWLALRAHRKYRRPAAGVWTGFVFLFGVPGLLAYWLEHRRPKMEACPECGRIVPRDREVCAACDAPFPSPAPVGTEIFA